MADHSCPVIKIKLEEHPDATSLSIVRIGGYQCVVRTSEWNDNDLAIYIPPDSIVPFNDTFKFLGEDHLRIKARKLRGQISYGMLVPAPKGCVVGQDASEQMGIEHWDPPISISMGGENVKPPPGIYPIYDVENFKSPKYHDIITEDENVFITEKIHGCSARYMWLDDKMWVGSRKNWKAYSEKNIWWKALSQNTWIEVWCKENPGLTIYGEVFGRVQSLKYGCAPNEFMFRAFDILSNGKWLDFSRAMCSGIPADGWVPILYSGKFDETFALQLAEENSAIPGADHHREGVVIRPTKERWDPKLGRVQLKIVGAKYLMKG